MKRKRKNLQNKIKEEVVGDVLFKPGQLYQTKDNRIIIILEVSKEELKRGINADKTGLYGFRGFWYGRDRFKNQVIRQDL